MRDFEPAGGSFDGVICIGGEDWWYHNRGHFDFQIMRRLAADWPVLFVNSLGLRMPDLGDRRLFAARMGRKLKSLGAGLANIENNFWVYSPLSIPGETGRRLTAWSLAPQIKRAASKAGIRRPLLWVHCPAGAALVDEIAHAGLILQRTDRFEVFPEALRDEVIGQIQALKRAADLVIYAAPRLADEEAGDVRCACLVTHGVETERFASAGRGMGFEPADMAVLARPRIGFVGGIDAHTFDAELFASVAARLPDCQFVLVGGCSLPERWCALPNVHFLGRKPYEAVAQYMAAMDVLIMPWNNSDWIKSCNPIKLKEYLAVGRPVVTTDFPALNGWRDLVHVGGDAAAFAAGISRALAEPNDHGAALTRLDGESWDAKTSIVRQVVADLGLAFDKSTAAA